MHVSHWRLLAAVVSVGGLLLACSGQAETAEAGEPVSVSLVTGLGDQPWEAYLDIALVDGYFAAENLDVEIVGGEDGTAGNLTLLEGGEVTFATVDMSTSLIEFSKGDDPAANREDPRERGHLNFVMTFQLHYDLMAAIVALAESGIVGARDLAGRSVAVLPGGANRALLPVVAQDAGFDGASITQVPGRPALFNAALKRGEVDATVAFMPELPSIEAFVGRPLAYVAYSDVLRTPPPGSTIAVRTDYAESSPDVVRAMGRAISRALAAVEADPERAGRLWWDLHNDTVQGWDEALAQQAVRIFADYIEAEPGRQLGEMDPARVARAIAGLHGVQAVRPGVTPDDVVRFDLAR